MILLIDNFDSFTYNIVQAYQKLGACLHVLRNHVKSAEEILEFSPKLLIIGPGPGNPQNAGISKACIALAKTVPVLGICLGHQAIGEVFGAVVVRAPKVMHGKTSPIYHTSKGLFAGMPQGFAATRYHSLIIDPHSLPASLELTAWTAQNEIMGIRHRDLPIQGVQFHPESIASEEGLHLLSNSLTM